MSSDETTSVFNASPPAPPRRPRRPARSGAKLVAAVGATDRRWDVGDHLDLVLNSLTDHAVLTLDTAGNITSWNHGARTTKGYDASEIIGRHFSLFYSQADRDDGVPMHALSLADQLGKYESEGWRLRKDGERFWASVVIHPVRDLDGTLRGFVKVTRDISDRLHVEKLKEDLSHSQRLELVGQLTGGVAHDFNNLLTTIAAGHDLLLQYSSDERVARVLDISRDAVSQSRKLITQLLAFSRRQVLNPTSANIFGLITSLDALLQRAVRSNIRFRWNLSPGLPPVLIDQGQFQSMLLNLIVNASDAMPDGGWLTIFMDRQSFSEPTYAAPYDIPAGDYLVLGVSDTGSGMSPEVQQHAIEPYFTTKAVGRGSGLGLSQCFGFARQSGGTIHIDSVPARGTTVRVLLPIRAEAAADAMIRQTRTILFVDDDSGVRTLVSEVLRRSGHTVIEADDGPSALKMLRDNSTIDYLFTDIVMPNDMNGVQLMNAVRAARPGLPTLLASGYPRDALPDLGKIPEDVLFIRKPYSLADLNAHIVSGGLQAA